LEEMHQYSKDKRLYEFFEFDPFKEIDDTKAYIEKLLQRMSESSGVKTTMYWFVRRKSDDRMIGTAGLANLNYGRQSVEWGYGVDPELWGNGYILQIQEILKNFTFEILKLNRLNGVTMVTNKRTIQSLLASGMKNEGVLRDFYCKNGVYIDAWQYGMIAKDYFESKKILFSLALSEEDIINVVSSVLTEENITIESNMENTFNWDSLNHMSIIVSLKEKLEIDLNPLEISKAVSIKNIHRIVNGNK